MKILWIKAGGLLPADTGGKIRSLQILKHLAHRHEVTVCTFYQHHDGDLHSTLATDVARLIAIPLPIPDRGSLKDALGFVKSVLIGKPHKMEKFYHPEVRQAVASLVHDTSFDIILCDFIYPAGVVDWNAPACKVLFTHNVEAEVWERFSKVAASVWWKVASFIEYKAMTRAERKYVTQADHVLTVSDHDREFFSRYVDPSKITTIPTGVDVEYFTPTPGATLANTIVFSGSMDWMPNEDGVLWFVSDIFPTIRRHIPDATFWIVGRNPSAAVQKLETHHGVHVTGTVEDIRPHLGRAATYVVPLRSGSGTRLKIFEAMAAGKAVVSTSIGAEGLPVHHGSNILLADEPETFADSVVALLSNPEEAGRLELNARQLVESTYGWEPVTATVEKTLLEACERVRHG
jgi:sugar transferase (PEP-CTERM/EpsH1 system associated)